MPVPLHEAKAALFRNIGHPIRIRVLELLCERDHAVHELLAAMEVEPSTLSQQLGILPLTGTSDAAHMREDLEASRFELSEEDVRFVETFAAVPTLR